MRWLARKFDSLLGAAAAAVVALGGSQFLAFVQQYRQRLGGHLDEARWSQGRLEAGQSLRALDPTAKAQVGEEIAARIEYLQKADAALRDAGLLARPVAFLRHFEPDIALATLHDFQPAVPIDAASLTYAAGGLLIGWLVYEGAKWPVAAAHRRRQKRKRAG